MIRVDRGYVVQTLAELVAINSVNPSLSPGAPGETDIARYVESLLMRLGMEVSISEAAPNRPSVVGVLKGSGGGRHLMLNGHLDTVAVDGMEKPFEPVVKDGRMYGRGTQDMKGSLAACFGAAKALIDSGERLAGNLVIACVADEEHASIGTADIVRRHRVDGAVVTEGTQLELCTAHKGFTWFEVVSTGRAAHGSRFDEGIDANLKMGLFLAELAKVERSLRGRPAHSLVGPPSLHAATIAGGTGLSTYAARCTLQIERRTVPGETPERVSAELVEIASRLGESDPDCRIEVRALLSREPFETRAGSPMVEAIQRAAGSVLRRPLTVVGKGGWMDSSLLGAAGIDTVIFGPSGGGLHTEVEWVDLDSVIRTAEVLAATARLYSGLTGLGSARLKPA